MHLQSGNLQLQHVRREIKKTVSFPEELSSLVNIDQGQILIDEIGTLTDQDDLKRWTYGLSRRQLNDLFSAVLLLPADSEGTFSDLLTVFNLRSTVSLSQTAWAYYQRHYPDERLGRVLSTVLNSLEPEEAPDFVRELKDLPVAASLPTMLAERLIGDPAALEKAKLAFSSTADSELNDRVSISQLRERYPLFFAYTTLTDVPLTTAKEHPLDTGLCGYMIRLALLPETPFAAAFLTAFFAQADDLELAGNADLFIQAMKVSQRPTQIQLLSRFLIQHRFSRRWDAINKVVRDLFGVPVWVDLTAPEEPDLPEPAVVESEPAIPAAYVPVAVTAPAPKVSFFARLFGRTKPIAYVPEPAIAPAAPAALPRPVEEKALPVIQISHGTLPESLLEIENPAGVNSIWQEIEPEQAMYFRRWAMLDQLNRHNGDDARKEQFLRRYALDIRSIYRWDEKTLLVDLGCCHLATCNSDEARLWLYDFNTLEVLLERQERPSLTKPVQTALTAREAMLDEVINNIVELPLDNIEMLYAHDYMKRLIEAQAAGLSKKKQDML